MADKKIILGRAAVKVGPDTSDFGDELKRDITKLERRLKVEIPVEANDKALEISTRQAVKALNAKSRANDAGLRIVLKGEVDFKGLEQSMRKLAQKMSDEAELDFDTKKATRALRELGDESEATRRELSEPFTIDTKTMLDDLATAGDRIDDELRELGRRKFQIEVDAELDIKNAQDAEWLKYLDDIAVGLNEQDKKKLKDFVDEYDGREIDLQPNVAAEVARAQMAVLTRTRVIDLVVRVKQSSIAKAEAALAALSGWRLLDDTFSNLRRMFENLDRNLPIVGSLALAVAGLSAWLLAAASNTFALAHSLAQMFQAALLLPAFLIAFVTGIGASIAVLKDFNAVLPEVGKMFGDLQNDMSSLFWSIARGPFQNLVTKLFPQFASGLEGTAVALGGFFGALANGLEKHVGKSMPQMFANLNDSILISAGGTDAMARSIEILGRRGSEYLPRLAAWFKRINERFADWLETNEKSGQLTEWIEEGIFEIRELGRALHGAGSLLAGFGRAAEKAGGSTLTIFADKLNNIAKIVNDEPFQSNLVNVFQGAHQAMETISRRSGPAFTSMMDTMSRTLAGVMRESGSAIGELLRGASEALGTAEFGSGLLSMFAGLRKGIEGLAPLWAPLGQALGTVGTLIGAMATNFGPLLGLVIGQLAELVVAVGPSLVPVIETLSGLLLDVLTHMAPAIAAIVGGLVTLVAGLVDSKAEVILLAAAFAAVAIGAQWGTITLFFTALPAIVAKAKFAVAGFLAFVPGMGVLALGLGAVAAAVAAAFVLFQGAGADAAPTTSRFAAAITEASIATAEMSKKANQSVAPTQVMAKELDKLFALDAGAGFADHLSEGTSQIDGMADAIRKADTGAFAQAMDGVADAVGIAGDTSKLANESIVNFDASIAAMVRSGNLEDAGVAADAFAEQSLMLGKDSGEVSAMLREYNLALEEHEAAQIIANRAAVQGREAILSYEGALTGVTSMSPGLIDSINETSKGFIDLATDVDEAGWSLDGYLTKLEEQVAAQANWADNMTALSGRVSEDVIAELDRMGVEGAPLVAELVNASDEELARLEEVVRLKMEGARGQVGTAFAGMSEDVITALEGLPADVKAQLTELGVITFDEAGKVSDAMTTGMAPDTEKIKADGVLAGEALGLGVSSTSAAVGVSASGVLNAATAGVTPTEATKTTWSNFGATLAGKFSEAVTAGKIGAGVAGSGVLAAAKTGITPSTPTLSEAIANGSLLSTNFNSGVTGGSAASTAAGQAVAAAAVAGLAPSVPSATDIGANIGLGVSTGIASKDGDAKSASAAMAAAVSRAFSTALGIHSPSTVFAEFGGWIVAGLNGGIGGGTASASTTIGSLASTIKNGFSTALGLTGSSSTIMSAFGRLLPAGLSGGISGNTGAVTSAMSGVQGKITIPNPASILVGAGDAVSRGFADGIFKAVHHAIWAVNQLRNALWLPGAGSALSGAGYAVIDGFVGALRSGFGRVRATLNALTSMLPSWKGPPSTDRTILHNAGQLVIDGFIAGLESRFDGVRDVLGDLTDEVADTEFKPMTVEASALGDVKGLRRQVAAGMADEADVSSRGSGGVVVHQTNHYPVAEPTSTATNKALQTAAALGL